MDLGTILDHVEELDDGDCIFARKPWSPSSDALSAPPGPNFSVPGEMARQGNEYFLEVHVAKEALGVFDARPPTKDEQRSLLLFYAENDAYPDWVFNR
jgi:hypothetical protein